MKRPHIPGPRAHHQNRVLTDLDGQIVPRAWNLTMVSNEQPLAIPECLELDLIVAGARVELPGQGLRRLIIEQTGEKGLTRIHAGRLSDSDSGMKGTLPRFA